MAVASSADRAGGNDELGALEVSAAAVSTGMARGGKAGMGETWEVVVNGRSRTREVGYGWELGVKGRDRRNPMDRVGGYEAELDF